MRVRPTGFGAFGVSASWEFKEGDGAVARRVLNFLEDRRLLFGSRIPGDAEDCVTSAFEIRRFLSEQIDSAEPGKSLERLLKSMRSACRAFIDAAGPPERSHLRASVKQPFAVALGELRGRIGSDVAVLANAFNLDVDEELATILPSGE